MIIDGREGVAKDVERVGGGVRALGLPQLPRSDGSLLLLGLLMRERLCAIAGVGARELREWQQIRPSHAWRVAQIRCKRTCCGSRPSGCVLSAGCTLGLDVAQYSLGYMHCIGFGVAEDYAAALRFFQLAAAQGHPEASFLACSLSRARSWCCCRRGRSHSLVQARPSSG